MPLRKPYPLLYQINTRVWLAELSRTMGRVATLDDIPNPELDALAAQGFDWIWLLSVWQTGPAGRRISRSNAEWRKEFEHTLSDLREEDIEGSGFAVAGYTVNSALGGDAALARLRERLCSRGLRLMLDFVPNHTALDHPWVAAHTNYYVSGTEEQRQTAPQNYTSVHCPQGERILAYGRDPYFAGWPDTLQLDYSNPETQRAMSEELTKIAGQCDGLRCDMAMLILPEVFEKTWGRTAKPFWPEAIQRVRQRYPEFCFMAEVYWDLEWTMQQQGFDYAYDKRLLDRLRDADARRLREHLRAGLDYQNKLARFLENHDEPRAAANFGPATHKAAAIVAYCSPGLRFFHQGQFEGKMKRISPHLVRGPNEPVNQELRQFYRRLLAVLFSPVLREGSWRLLDCRAAWEGNWTWDCYLAFAWEGQGEQLLVVVNYAPNQSQCYIRLPFADFDSCQWRLKDLIGDDVYDRDGADLQLRGLYVDMPPWKASVFSCSRCA